jgi:hypothetical protein
MVACDLTTDCGAQPAGAAVCPEELRSGLVVDPSHDLLEHVDLGLMLAQ